MNIHEEAVNFRNRKRKEYLSGELTNEEKRFVERWDCEPDEHLKRLTKNNKYPITKKMFNVNLREEPLSIDIKLAKLKN